MGSILTGIPKGPNEQSQEVADVLKFGHREGYLWAKSVGFLPLTLTFRMTGKELR